MQQHNNQIAKKRKEIKALELEVKKHNETMKEASSELFVANSAIEKLMNQVPTNRMTEVVSKIYSTTEDQTDYLMSEFRPSKILLELEFKTNA
jgi:septal ring factor EnvC (AmiA/AmiB activator)